SRSTFWYSHDRLVRILATAALAWGAAYLVWRIGWSGRGTSLALFLPLLAAELFGWCSLAFYAFFAWRAPRLAPRPAPERTLSVDVFVCTYDEPPSVLEPTLLACAAISSPHTTYVLDDGQRPEVRELALRHGARYITRP